MHVQVIARYILVNIKFCDVYILYVKLLRQLKIIITIICWIKTFGCQITTHTEEWRTKSDDL